MRIVAPISKNLVSKAKFAKKLTFLCGDYTPFPSKSFKSETTSFNFSPESFKSLDIQLWEVGAKKNIKQKKKHWYQKILFSKVKFSQKTNFVLRGNFTTFICNFFFYLRPLPFITFPQGFWISKNVDLRLWEVGAKRCLNGTSQVNR